MPQIRLHLLVVRVKGCSTDGKSVSYSVKFHLITTHWCRYKPIRNNSPAIVSQKSLRCSYQRDMKWIRIHIFYTQKLSPHPSWNWKSYQLLVQDSLHSRECREQTQLKQPQALSLFWDRLTMLFGSALRRQAYFHYQENRVEMQPSLFLSSRDSLLSRPVVMTDVSCEWQHCFGGKGEPSFPALASDSSSSHQEWRFLTNIHLLFYQEDRQSHFAKTIQGFRMTKPIPQPPRKSQCFWDLWPFLQIWGLLPYLGVWY